MAAASAFEFATVAGWELGAVGSCHRKPLTKTLRKQKSSMCGQPHSKAAHIRYPLLPSVINCSCVTPYRRARAAACNHTTDGDA